MMSLSSRRELASTLRPRYLAASKSQKGLILDEFVLTTDYDRKYAVKVLSSVPAPPPQVGCRRNRTRKYDAQVAAALVALWKTARCVCAARLVPFVPSLILALERHGQFGVTRVVRDKLCSMSVSTARRLLSENRRGTEKGVGATRPGTLLRNDIPIRTFADWDDVRPGFFEADLVAHCGDTGAGDFVYTLTMTDVFTGWTETVAVPNKGQTAVCEGIETIRKRLPFPMLGIDCDNGSEFVNHHLKRYCDERRITFTRSRPYKKNDQCRVEQKNGAVVRPVAGYARYEGKASCDALNQLYVAYRLYLNFFAPCLKLVSKSRNGPKVTRKFDGAKTPYERLASSGAATPAKCAELKAFFEGIDPTRLNRRIDEREAAMARHAVRQASWPRDGGHGSLGSLHGAALPTATDCGAADPSERPQVATLGTCATNGFTAHRGRPEP
jgi:hypothetical protein